jgi:hypothetical protein
MGAAGMGTPSCVASTLTNTAHAPQDDTKEIGTCGKIVLLALSAERNILDIYCSTDIDKTAPDLQLYSEN